MNCPFLRVHDCEGCQSDWRCDGATPPFVLENEDMDVCFSDGYLGCPNYDAGVKFREQVNETRLEERKKQFKIDVAMKQLDGILRKIPEDLGKNEILVWRISKLKKLYRARLSDLHEYKATLKRYKEEKDK